LAEQLTPGLSTTFCDSNMLEHINFLNLKFLLFYVLTTMQLAN